MDLSWSTHCDYIIKKANHRLYALRKLKACGVQDGELMAVYCSLLRPVPRVYIGSFSKLTAVSLLGDWKSTKESLANHLWS